MISHVLFFTSRLPPLSHAHTHSSSHSLTHSHSHAHTHSLSRSLTYSLTHTHTHTHTHTQVTKPRYFHKPTYDTLNSSLLCLRDRCLADGVTSLCMPRIGCGLDKLNWTTVVVMINTVFGDCDISITAYNL